jgi:hypothetical protein
MRLDSLNFNSANWYVSSELNSDQQVQTSLVQLHKNGVKALTTTSMNKLSCAIKETGLCRRLKQSTTEVIYIISFNAFFFVQQKSRQRIYNLSKIKQKKR